MDAEILRYRSSLAYNREIFLIEHGSIFKEFSTIDENFVELAKFPQRMRDTQGESYASMVPFLLLLQRQSRAAFESFAVYQAYQAWVVLRPGVEALLMIGKFLDDPKLVGIWQDRREHPAAYRRAFSGKELRSVGLPASDKIQAVLSKINDDFVHANVDYFYRHLGMDAGDPVDATILLDYFDKAEFLEAHVLAFLHLLLVMQGSLSGLFAKLFGVDILLKAQTGPFLKEFGLRIKSLASRSEEAGAIFTNLGLVELEQISVS
jgi:hypothetical protein